ncbi:MAG: MerR family transcriptional regulator [Ruminococcus sp.]|nr:MerR family transcriptional regulator [Ruminococcus sp.]
MKIKEVCRKTGLTEKAVRYYVESGLVTPEEYTQRGRTFREYSEEDAEALRNVSTLRHIGLSVEEIRSADSGGAARVMEGFLRDLGSEVERKQKLLDALSRADWTDTRDAAGLAKVIEAATRAEPAPPDFSRFNDSEEYSDDLRAFEERSFKREQHQRRGARAGLIVTAALLFGSVMALTNLIGILLFAIAALAAIGLGSDYLGFYRLMCITGAIADGIGFGRSLGDLENGGLLMQIFSSGRAEPGVTPCILYLGATAALLGSLAMLMTNKALIDYLIDRR